MKRLASAMFLKPDCEKEYKERHDRLWPEMELALKNHGASNYSIFLYSDKNTSKNILFAYLEVESEQVYNAIADTEICKKWWKYMAPLMETNDDYSPVVQTLSELFYLK